MNKFAQALGRLGKGHPKNFTKAERERRRVRLVKMNKARSVKIRTSQTPETL